MRNYGLSRREDSNGGGGGSPPGSHGSNYALPNLISFPAGTPLERREFCEPSLDECQPFSNARLFLILLSPSLVVLTVVVGYMAFVS
jgi:hypothetical protein